MVKVGDRTECSDCKGTGKDNSQDKCVVCGGHGISSEVLAVVETEESGIKSDLIVEMYYECGGWTMHLQFYEKDGQRCDGMHIPVVYWQELLAQLRPRVPPGIAVVEVYECPGCHNHWRDPKAALNCCSKKPCKVCGAERPYKWEGTCEKCELEKMQKEGRILDDWKGPVYIDMTDAFFSSMDALIEHLKDMGPDVLEFVIPCTEHKAEINADLILENLLEDAYEDACEDLVEDKELKDFIAAWNKKQTIVSCNADYTRRVRVPKAAPLQGAK